MFTLIVRAVVRAIVRDVIQTLLPLLAVDTSTPSQPARPPPVLVDLDVDLPNGTPVPAFPGYPSIR